MGQILVEFSERTPPPFSTIKLHTLSLSLSSRRNFLKRKCSFPSNVFVTVRALELLLAATLMIADRTWDA
jgi:hypothetical protein